MTGDTERKAVQFALPSQTILPIIAAISIVVSLKHNGLMSLARPALSNLRKLLS